MSYKTTKRGKIWHYSGNGPNGRLRGTTGTTDKKAAQKIAAKAYSDAWQGAANEEQKLTMAQAFIAYLDAGKSDKYLPKLAEYWKDTPVTKITSAQIQQCARKVYPNAKPATQNRQAIVPTQAAINYCADMGWCKHVRVKRFKVDTPPKPFVTDEWAQAFQDHASPHLGALCRFMFETGARLGEAVALTWDDINLVERTANIAQTKTNKMRVARITPNALAAMANIPSHRNPDAKVFGYAGSHSVKQTWDAVIQRAGIERMTPHSCRHGFATAALRAGIDARTVAKWGGWEDMRVLLETYAHAITDPTVIDEAFGTNMPQATNHKTLTNCKQRKIS